MKRKTIGKIIHGKFEDFLKSIKDEKLVERMREGTIVTGGCIPSLFLDEEVNDFDLYFRNQDLARDVARYYVDKLKQGKSNEKNITIEVRENRTGGVLIYIKSSGIADEDYEYFESTPVGEGEEFLEKKFQENNEKYGLVYASANAITLNNGVQLILRFAGEPKDIHKNYDFVHCTGYWTSWDQEVIMTEQALESILTKELRYVGSLFPICSMIRLRKFISRGWNINAGHMFKIAWDINHLNLSDTEVLKDQLLGVDVAYFNEVIQSIERRRAEGKEIDSTYLMILIDKVFE